MNILSLEFKEQGPLGGKVGVEEYKVRVSRSSHIIPVSESGSEA